jgi:membrane protein YqaA with SNARE-associated domain
VFAVVKANEALFWPAVLVGTLGNTLGGAFDYFLGYRAKVAFAKERKTRWFGWLARYGPKTMLLSWVPGIGDPLCTMAGWLHMPFWASVGYMAIGKFARYVSMTALLLYVPGWRTLTCLYSQTDIGSSAGTAATELYPAAMRALGLSASRGSPAWCSAIS